MKEQQCKNCGKELKDEASQERGFGPECWNKQKAKGSLPILVTFHTGDDRTNQKLFPGINSDYDFVIALDATELFGGGGLEISEDIKSVGIFQWMANTIEEGDAYGQMEVLMYARKRMIPAKTLPEVPPNLMGKKKKKPLSDFEEEWTPFLSWNTKRIELMSLKPKRWELKNGNVQLVYGTDFATGSLFVEEDELPDHLEGDEFSEKYAEVYGDIDWIPTMGFEEWMDGEKTRLWKDNPHLTFFKEIIQEKNIVLAVDEPDLLGLIIGDKWQQTTEAWEMAREWHSAFSWDHGMQEMYDYFYPPDCPIEPKAVECGYENCYRFMKDFWRWDGSVEEMSDKQVALARKAGMLDYCSDIWEQVCNKLESIDPVYTGVHQTVLSELEKWRLQRSGLDSNMIIAVKETFVKEFAEGFAEALEGNYASNMDCDWGDPFDDTSEGDYHAFNLFGKGDYHAKRKMIADVMMQVASMGLKRLITPVLKTGNEIFEKKKYD